MTKFNVSSATDVNVAPLERRVGVAGAVAVGLDVEQGEEAKKVEIIDMRGASKSEVEARLDDRLKVGDVVLTGSEGGEDGIIEEFDPSMSNLRGKKPSIYATDDPEVAMFNAILDKRSPVATALRILDGGEGASSQMVIRDGESPKFQIPQHMAEAIKNAIELGPESTEWQSLFRDGVVYALPKDKFSRESPMQGGEEYPTDHEWNSQDKVVPEAAVLVSSGIISEILRFDGEDANVEIVPKDDSLVLDQFAEGMSIAIPDGVEQFGVTDLLGMAGDSNERVIFARRVEAELGSEKLPKDEFIRRAAKIYRDMILERAKVA
jgi:hypothetical protein